MKTSDNLEDVLRQMNVTNITAEQKEYLRNKIQQELLEEQSRKYMAQQQKIVEAQLTESQFQNLNEEMQFNELTESFIYDPTSPQFKLQLNKILRQVAPEQKSKYPCYVELTCRPTNPQIFDVIQKQQEITSRVLKQNMISMQKPFRILLLSRPPPPIPFVEKMTGFKNSQLQRSSQYE
ncbi:Hypothetical_protein [Hexamita inflata]|uniref:Hypothetical_protein n=1 Tax=Hexamita inflata TaxID=28002 RepID=A0AA86PP01_9EUKA|nr:Hypothetical protein HINF_LOCUS26122 [Hexamita inflata]